MLIVGLVFLKAIDKLHMPNRIVSFGILFLVAYLLQKLMQDIVLISGMALLGEMIDVIFFQRWIRKTRETIIIEKTADVTTGKVEDVLRRYMGGGA